MEVGSGADSYAGVYCDELESAAKERGADGLGRGKWRSGARVRHSNRRNSSVKERMEMEMGRVEMWR
jgi:hypothetical protein